MCAEFLTAEHKAQVHQLMRIIGNPFEKGKAGENQGVKALVRTWFLRNVRSGFGRGQRNMLKWNLVATAALLIAGCTTQQIIAQPLTGSRADGTVQMSYNVGAFEGGKVDYTGAQLQAEERCKAWGYTSAEKFGGEQRMCTAPSQYGCMSFQVNMSYQCTGLTQKQ